MLSNRERKRYARQILQFGEGGQERLRKAHVFIAGAGGLGSSAAIYLAATGIGKITIVDKDCVDLTNLNRQILHWESDLGRLKVDSAKEKLSRINSDISIESIAEIINGENLGQLVGRANIIVDAMDNFQTRYLLNRVAIEKRIPLVHGAIRGFDGQVTTIIPGDTACFRCIFKTPPPAEKFPVIGVTAGLIGLMQANEVVKFVIGIGDLLKNRILFWNGLGGRIEEVALERDPSCIDCGKGESWRREEI